MKSNTAGIVGIASILKVYMLFFNFIAYKAVYLITKDIINIW